MRKRHLIITTIVTFFVTALSAQILPPVTVKVATNPSPGALYIAPNSRVTSPPFSPSLMVVGNDGKPIVSRFLQEYAFDFRILPDGRLGYSVFQSAGTGPRASSSVYVLDTNLIVVDSLQGANGYNLAMHSFDILPNGNRLLIMQENVTIDMSVLVPGGNPAASVQQMLLQEIDINGNIIFQWRSLDHFPITVSYEDLTAPSIRYFHLNSVTLDHDGNFLISARHASLIAKIHRTTGKVLWILGGKLNQFTFNAVPGITDDPRFSYQHDIVRLPNGNISLFDNGTQRTPQWSRAVEYRLDEEKKECVLVRQYRKSPDIYAGVQGSVQTLSNGNRVVAWGSALQNNRTVITEIDSDNKEVYETELPSMMYPYKALRAPYPTGRYSADVLIDEILPTNTYTYTRGTDTVGLKITYHTLISFFYNTTTARRYMWAPVNPRFERVVDGKRVPTQAPYNIYPSRVTLTQEGMVDHAGEFRFSVNTLGISDPENTTVYYRDSIEQKAFRPLRTRYNPNSRELIVDTARTGEFCFGGPLPEQADSITPPRLLFPISGKRVRTGTPINLAVSPQGQTQRITYQILSDKKDVLFTSTLPTDKISASPLPTGAYFWRAKAGYGSSESDYSALDSFQVSEPFLEISRPGDSAVWYQDSSYVVTWNTNIDVPVIIELVRDDVRVALIKDNVPGLQGGFLWKVPVSVAVGTGYAVRITPMDATSDALTTTTPFSIEVRGVPSSVTENNIRQHLTIGPNPATSDLFIGGHLLISRLMIFDSKGLLVLDRQVQGTGDVIDITPLPQGMYVLRCETHLGIVNTPIVVRR